MKGSHPISAASGKEGGVGVPLTRDLAQIDESDGADEAYVIRFDGKGQICFRHVGPVTDTAASALLAADCGQGTAGGRSETLTD